MICSEHFLSHKLKEYDTIQHTSVACVADTAGSLLAVAGTVWQWLALAGSDRHWLVVVDTTFNVIFNVTFNVTFNVIFSDTTFNVETC